MKNKIDQKLFHSIQTGNFNEDTKQIIIHITSDNIIAEFAYPRNKQSLKIDNYHTRSYHIPSTLIEDFGKLYIHHVTKKINELFRELKKDLRETKDRKEQVQIVVQGQEHINNLTHNLKKENHHQDVLALHIEDRIHRALGLSFFHKDELDTIHTIDRKIKSQIQKLSTITNYIVEDIDHNFEVRLEKKPNNPFRNEKKNHQGEEKYYTPEQQLGRLGVNISILISDNIGNNKGYKHYNIGDIFHDLAHNSEDQYENTRIFPDSLYKIIDKKKKKRKK